MTPLQTRSESELPPSDSTSATAAAERNSGAAIIGKVIRGDGRTVAEVTVHLIGKDPMRPLRRPSSLRTVQTGKDGAFRFEKVEPGQYALTAEKAELRTSPTGTDVV